LTDKALKLQHNIKVLQQDFNQIKEVVNTTYSKEAVKCFAAGIEKSVT